MLPIRKIIENIFNSELKYCNRRCSNKPKILTLNKLIIYAIHKII